MQSYFLKCKLIFICRKSIRLFSKQQPAVFDRNLKAKQRDYAIRMDNTAYYDYIREEAAIRIVDRLDDIKRTFPHVLDIGSHRGHILRALVSKNEENETSIGGIDALVQCDTSKSALLRALSDASTISPSRSILTSQVIADEESLPFADNTFDLVMSCMVLNWVNDIPTFLKKVLSILKPDGAFVASLLGGSTLQELRHSFYLAELDRRGGFSPHLSPLALPSDVASLMQGAGFSLPTIDVDTITVHYPDAFVLMEHLRAMGEGHAALNRQLHVGKDTMLAMAAVYQELYGLEDGSIPATFQLISVIGWSPHTSQQQPKRRGSQQKSFKEISSV